jgi:hypothetical protein
MSLTPMYLKDFYAYLKEHFSGLNKDSATDINVSSEKALRNLAPGEDDELSAAYEHFHKMVEQEEGAVRNTTLAAVGQLQKESTAIQASVQEGLVITGRTDLNTKTILDNTEILQRYLQSMIILDSLHFFGI